MPTLPTKYSQNAPLLNHDPSRARASASAWDGWGSNTPLWEYISGQRAPVRLSETSIGFIEEATPPLANSSWDRSISSQTHTVWGCTCTLPPESHLILAQGNLAVYTQRKNGYPLLQWRPQMGWQMGWKREEGRGEWALRALLWSSSKLDKVQGFRVWAWLSWQCGDMCLWNRRRVEGLFKLAR